MLSDHIPVVVTAGGGVVEVEVVEEVEEERSESTMVPPSLRMARHRPFSSEYFSTALMSAMTTPGPRMAPMYLTVMFPSSATRLWQLVLGRNYMLKIWQNSG